MRKKRLEKSVEVLIEKAEVCAVLAKGQRESADQQHLSAQKMEKLSQSLIDGAVEIEHALAMREPETGPVLSPSGKRVAFKSWGLSRA